MKKNKREKAKKFYADIHQEKMKKYRRSDTCRGGREHDFILTIPDYYIDRIKNITPEIIEEYYKIQEKKTKFEIEIVNDYNAIGINKSYYYGRDSKTYICSVCGKKIYK